MPSALDGAGSRSAGALRGSDPVTPARSLVVVDYGGYPCQVQLSRVLAGRGWDVVHLHCPGYVGGKGRLDRAPDDPVSFTVEPLLADRPVQRYSPVSRLRHEVAFARAADQRIGAAAPDVVMLANVPLLALRLLARLLSRRRIPYVFWQQDVTSLALGDGARRRLGPLGAPAAAAANAMERRVARDAAAVVPIGSAFVPVLDAWGVPAERIEVIGNWPPLADVPVVAKDNPWARAHDLAGRPVAAYAGTLGLKHDPSALLALARTFAETRPDARLLVVSEGLGREWLAERGGGLEQLVLVDFQPYDRLPEVLGTADVLLTVLEPEAGAFSVPSKVLTYLCAGRPVVASMPPSNAAARTIVDAGAGVVVDVGDRERFVEAVDSLLDDPNRRARLGAAARSYAEREFDVDLIATRFRHLISSVSSEQVGSRHRRP